MNAVDVIKWEVSDKELVYKFLTDEIRLGSQLIVYPTQTAFLVKGGQILDEFTSGTYTIKSENIPLLGKIINIPFNKETPFKTDVWFVNQITLLDCKWGTATPLQMEDPKYEVIVPVRAYGQYGFRITEPRTFLKALVGNMSTFSTQKVVEYYRGVILSKLTAIIYEKMKQNGMSVLNINANVEELSDYAKGKLSDLFIKYGIELVLFNIISISVQDNDPSFLRLKAAKDAAAKIKIIGRDDYKLTRSFDVLEKAAENENGTVGAAVGIGAGVGIGGVVGAMAVQNINSQNPNSNIPTSVLPVSYYIAIDGKSQGPFDIQTISQKIANGELSENTLAWKKGMNEWRKVSELADFKNLFSANCPPPIPQE